MPKLKTKSGAKKRFKLTATGKVVTPSAASGTADQATAKYIRHQRGTR